jgi:hypothetical protein
MCKCIEETIDRLKTKLTEAGAPGKFRPKNAESIRFCVPKNGGINFTTGKTQLMIPFSVTWTVPGKTLGKDIEVPVLATHCPFCGTSLE